MPTSVFVSIDSSKNRNENVNVVYYFDGHSEQPDERCLEKRKLKKQASIDFLEYQDEWLKLRNSKIASLRHL